MDYLKTFGILILVSVMYVIFWDIVVGPSYVYRGSLSPPQEDDVLCTGFVENISFSGSGNMVIHYLDGSHCIAYGMHYVSVATGPDGKFILKSE